MTEGVVLTMHKNHIILDGYSQVVVDNVFAHHLSRAMEGLETTRSGLMPAEAFDKSSAWGAHPARPMLEWRDWKRAPENDMSLEQQVAEMVNRMARLTVTVWHLSREQQAALRKHMQDPSKPKLSLATCLSTWVWRLVTKARGHGPDTVTQMLTPVQTRGRVKELHANYSGSALVYGYAQATASELRSLPTCELGSRIAQGVAWWTPERIREYWGSIEECDDLGTYRPNMDRDFGTDVEVTNIVNTPFYSIHWGPGLVSRAWRLPGTAFIDGWTFIQPRQQDGGIEMLVYLSRDVLTRMMKDPELWRYADYWAASDPRIDVEAAAHNMGQESARL